MEVDRRFLIPIDLQTSGTREHDGFPESHGRFFENSLLRIIHE
jgi:hypothetical protein